MKLVRCFGGFVLLVVGAGLFLGCAQQRQQQDVPQYDTINVVNKT